MTVKYKKKRVWYNILKSFEKTYFQKQNIKVKKNVKEYSKKGKKQKTTTKTTATTTTKTVW